MIKDIIRTTVVKTNPYWPFSRLNKIPYHLAIKTLVQYYKKFPEIKSVYLTHSVAEGNWVPGLSDIDWIIIIYSNITSEHELVFLETFWHSYGRIKKLFFPMLGEGTIISEYELENMLFSGVKTYESRNWNLIYGTDCSLLNYNQNCITKSDMFFHASQFYFESLIKKFFYREGSPFLLREEINRISQKIIKYVHYENHIEEELYSHKTAYDSFSSVIRKLNKSIPNFSEYNLQKFKELKITLKKDETNKKTNNHYFNIKRFSVFSKYLISRRKECIDAIIDQGGFAPFVIIRDTLDDKELSKFLIDIRELASDFHVLPYIVTKKMFENSIEFYNPFWYYGLIYDGVFLYGKDIRNEIKSPIKFAFVKHAIRMSINLFSIVRRPSQIDRSYIQWLLSSSMDHPAINYFLREAIEKKLLLEKGVIAFQEKTLFDEWKRCYYDSYSSFEKIHRKENVTKMHLATMKFSLLRNLIRDLDRLVSITIKDW